MQRINRQNMTKTYNQEQFHLARIKSTKFRIKVLRVYKDVRSSRLFRFIISLWTVMVRVIWLEQVYNQNVATGVLMSLHCRPTNHHSRVYAGCYNRDNDCTWEFRRTHNRRTGFRVRAVQCRHNKRSRLQVRASRDVLNAISISRPRGSAVSSRCHAMLRPA